MATENKMEITMSSILDYQDYTMEMPITASELADGYARQDGGCSLQDAFPTLDLDQRYFLMTGITPEEYKKEYGEEN
jgi:hypothetical protein